MAGGPPPSGEGGTSYKSCAVTYAATNSLAANHRLRSMPGPLCGCACLSNMIASYSQPRLSAVFKPASPAPSGEKKTLIAGLTVQGERPGSQSARRSVEAGFRAMLNGCGTGGSGRGEARGADMGRTGDWRPGYRILSVGPIGGLSKVQ